MHPFSSRFSRARWVALLCLLAFVSGFVRTAHASPGKRRYSHRVRIALNQTVTFPAFTLRYIGPTHVKSAVFPPGFTYENFVVNACGHEQTIQWCGGTGVPEPAAFKVAGRSFRLEPCFSWRLGVPVLRAVVLAPAAEG